MVGRLYFPSSMIEMEGDLGIGHHVLSGDFKLNL